MIGIPYCQLAPNSTHPEHHKKNACLAPACWQCQQPRMNRLDKAPCKEAIPS